LAGGATNGALSDIEPFEFVTLSLPHKALHLCTRRQAASIILSPIVVTGYRHHLRQVPMPEPVPKFFGAEYR
jgi:hypothetical protein